MLCSRNIYWYFMLNNKKKYETRWLCWKVPFIFYLTVRRGESDGAQFRTVFYFSIFYLVTFTRWGWVVLAFFLYLFKQNSSNACLNLLICWKIYWKFEQCLWESIFKISTFFVLCYRDCCSTNKYIIIMETTWLIVIDKTKFICHSVCCRKMYEHFNKFFLHRRTLKNCIIYTKYVTFEFFVHKKFYLYADYFLYFFILQKSASNKSLKKVVQFFIAFKLQLIFKSVVFHV